MTIRTLIVYNKKYDAKICITAERALKLNAIRRNGGAGYAQNVSAEKETEKKGARLS